MTVNYRSSSQCKALFSATFDAANELQRPVVCTLVLDEWVVDF